LDSYSVWISAIVKAAGMFAAALLVYRKWGRENLGWIKATEDNEQAKKEASPGDRKSNLEVLKILLLGITASLAFNSWFSVLGITQSVGSYTQVAEVQFALPLVLGLIIYGIISPVAEEMVFRGIVYRKMRDNYGVPIALVGSALIFGAIHGNLVQGIYGTAMGLLAAWLDEREKKLAAPILFHGAANAVVYLVSSTALWQVAFSLPGAIIELVLFLVILVLQFYF
jgi:hypothetical protein